MTAKKQQHVSVGTGLVVVAAALASCQVVGCTDPNANPIVDVVATCQADSQAYSFFGSAFTYDNDTGRALLAHSFDALAANSEASLACGVEPSEGYRLTIVGDWPNVPF